VRGPRGLLLWCLLTAGLAVALLATRPSGEAGIKAVAVAALASPLGVLATQGWLRRAVCVVVALLALPPLVSGHAVPTVLAALLLAAALVGAALCPSWPAMGRRYDQGGAGSETRTAAADQDLWTRIDRGEDPTA
jgi:hypothetical protein